MQLGFLNSLDETTILKNNFVGENISTVDGNGSVFCHVSQYRI